MSKGVLKYYNTTELSNVKVIDSNSRMEQKLTELKSVVPVLNEIEHFEESEEEGEPGFEELNPDALEALTMDQDAGEGAIIKADPGIDLEAEIAAARAQADEIVATAEQLAIEYKENARREVEIECSRIRANAQQEGYDFGIRQASDEYESRMRAVDAKMVELDQEYAMAIEALEPKFVALITDIYERIFNIDLSEYEQILVNLVTDTMRKSDNSRSFLIHFSSEDYRSLSEQNREELEAASSGAKIDIIEDIGLSRGQCLLETDNGVLDCGVDTQLSELKKKLMILSYTPDTEL